jgi:hypothetical protein
MIPQVAASERGRAQTGAVAKAAASGVVGPATVLEARVQRNTQESVTTEGDSPVSEAFGIQASRHLSTAEHEKFCGKQRGPSRKAKYYRETDSGQVP